MQGFLRHNHDDSAHDGRSQWRYNNKGYHPIHTLMESLCAKRASFPKDLPTFHNWAQATRDKFVLDLVKEAVDLTNHEYGDCTCRTQCDRPPNNTPLMFFAKAECKVVNLRTRYEILETLVWQGGGLSAVDSNGNNAVMHAAGSDNRDIFYWFYDRARILAEDCDFKWNHKNDDTRNMLAMVRNRGDTGDILNWCIDLATTGWLDDDYFASDPPRRGGPGGSSGANQRYRPWRKHWNTRKW